MLLSLESRIGRRRGTTHIALFPRPSPERGVSVSEHLALQCLFPVRVSMLPVSALSISDTSLSAYSKHLPGFALWTTFSSSLVERDFHDYYPGSVTLSLSTRRAIPSSLAARRSSLT